MSSKEDSVKLDIGGTVFRTKRSTITICDGLLKTMMETYTPGREDCIFIDRSAKHFDYILNYLRHGWVNFPESVPDVQDIHAEAVYYKLRSLENQCMEKLRKLRKLPEPKNGVPENMRILETYEEVLRAITRIEKPLIIMYYSVNNDGTLTVPKESALNGERRDFWQFWEKYSSKFEIYYKRSEIIKTGDEEEDSQWQFTIYHNTKTRYTSTPQDCCEFWESINEEAERYLNFLDQHDGYSDEYDYE